MIINASAGRKRNGCVSNHVETLTLKAQTVGEAQELALLRQCLIESIDDLRKRLGRTSYPDATPCDSTQVSAE
jgi:hypothetical protein